MFRYSLSSAGSEASSQSSGFSFFRCMLPEGRDRGRCVIMFSRSGFGLEHAGRGGDPTVIPHKWRRVVNSFGDGIAFTLLTEPRGS